ncbi:hypothetical protein CAFE_28080 [Caprobacter fermentans]|uniref:Uncharacterized protein n=1 Tax=Caproicibacter fermentans TaxID=2576756 RepID=A0A6N8I2U5_9FIRM|nr:hypothetical protein [Caproicibacter fermentans]MVB12077.1 hypothetical protein [Caproicibacter fermentans]OCN02254.1 hypothetical protein A7X67_06295 [Clostridium sp. W14A]
MTSEFNQQWQKMLKSIGARSMPWRVTGGNEWISYNQVDENDYYVQIFLHGSFDDYKRQKDAVVAFFFEQGSQLVDETQVKDIAFGYWKELRFVDKSKVEQQKQAYIPQIGSIYAPGAIINFGNMSASTISIDNSVHEIEKLIEEKGDDDKAELYAILEETKAIVRESIDKKQLISKPGFIERLTTHLSKHGWFYGAILQLLGTAFLL